MGAKDTSLTVMDLPEPGRLTPTNEPFMSYSATVCRSLMSSDTPRGFLPGSAGPSAGRKVAHSLPLMPALEQGHCSLRAQSCMRAVQTCC